MGGFLGSVFRAVMNGAGGALIVPTVSSGELANAVGGVVLMGLSLVWSKVSRKDK